MMGFDVEFRFEDDFAPFVSVIVTDVWGLLVPPAGASNAALLAAKSSSKGRLQRSGLGLLTTVARSSAHHTIFQSTDVLGQVCKYIVMPLAQLTEDDEENFEDNPQQYAFVSIGRPYLSSPLIGALTLPL